MTVLAEPRQPVGGHPRESSDRPVPRLSRIWRLGLVWHVLALAVVLTVGLLAVVPDSMSHADEGAALAQAEILGRDGGWALEHPLPAVDPDGEAFPIELTTRRGATDEYVPFAKHPLYPVLLAPLLAVHPAGAILLSVAGGLAAAVAAALLARRLDPTFDRAALWVCGLATPLLYDSYVVIAHTLAAAAVGFSVLWFLDPDRRASRTVLGAAALAVAVLLRNEAVLLGIAFAGVCGVVGVVRRRRTWITTSAAAFAGTVAAYLLDARFASWVLHADGVEPFAIEREGSFLADRWSAFSFTVLAPSDESAIGLLLSTLGVALTVAAAVVARRRPADVQGFVVFLTGAAIAMAARLVIEPSAHVPGLFFATPIVIAGLVMLDRQRLRDVNVYVPLATFALFFLAVVATQYSNGGGGGWGGRYFAIGIPLVVPAAIAGFRDGGERIDAAGRRAGVGLAVLLIALLGAQALMSLAIDRRVIVEYRATVAAATDEMDAGDGGEAVVVTTKPGLGRFAYEMVLEQRWIEIGDGDVSEFAPRLLEAGIDRFVIVTADPERDLDRLGPWYSEVDRRTVSVSLPFGGTSTMGARVIVVEANHPG